MKNLLLSVAAAALLCTPAFAQDANVTNSPNSAASNSGSAADSTSISGAVNGPIDSSVRVGPIDSSVRVGPTSAESTSNSGAVSNSETSSVSTSQGGNSLSNAQATGGNAQTGASTSSATANPNANNQGNAQSITFNQTAPSKQKLETVPQVYAPALSTTLTETCMGSTSGGVSVMGFGGTLGSTWNDDQCVRRLNARELAQTIGDRDAALALLCQDKDVAQAYAALGRSCLAGAPKIVMISQQAAQPAAPEAPPAHPPGPVVKEPVTMQPIPNPPADGERG